MLMSCVRRRRMTARESTHRDAYARNQLLRTDLEGVAKRLADRPFCSTGGVPRARRGAQARPGAHARAAGETKRVREEHRTERKRRARMHGADGRGRRSQQPSSKDCLRSARGESKGASTTFSPSCRTSRTRACRSGARRRQRRGAPGGRAADVRVRARRTTSISAPELGLLDFERATKIAGARFALMTGGSRSSTARSRSSCSTCTRASTATSRCMRRTWSTRRACSARGSCRSSRRICSRCHAATRSST